MQHALNARARGLRERDEARFRRTLRRGDRGLVADQQTYFDNISQLPVGVLRYKVDPATITPVQGSGDYWVEVVMALGLDGYDAAPVRTRDRFRFTPVSGGRRMVVASTNDEGWERDHPGNAQPWDLERITVDQSAGVLGIFDDSTSAHSRDVIDAATEGRYDVRSVLGVTGETPVASGAVVYSVQDAAFLRGLAGQTVGDPDRADGLTIAVPVDGAAPRRGVASYRVYLNPRVLDDDRAVLGRLVRHELTHATLRQRGRRAPLWLNEGIAEYVSVQPMPPERRRLPADALEVGARARDLPGEREFASADAEAWYAVSWWVCEYIARTYGPATLFGLLDRIDAGGDPAEVVSATLGITTGQLTQRGVALMTTQYR